MSTTTPGICAPLTSAQRRLWFLHELEPHSVAYNITVALDLRGPLQIAALRATVAWLGRRHEMLRATFGLHDDQPRQWIGSAGAPLRLIELASPGAPWTELERQLGATAQRPFDLARGPTAAWYLFRLDPSHHVLVLAVHHIVFDGESLAVICAELERGYRAALGGQPHGSSEPAPSYCEVADLEREFASEDGPAFWRDSLIDAPVRTAVFGPSQAIRRGTVSGVVATRFTVTELQALDELCRRQGVTRYMALLAAFASMITRYSGHRDVLVGTPIALRGLDELAGVVGMLVNTLPLRLRLDGASAFRDVLSHTRDAVLAAMDHRLTAFDDIVAALNVPRDPLVTPLVQTVFAYQRRPDPPDLPAVTSRILPVPARAAQYELAVTAVESASGVEIALEADAAVCDDAVLRRFARYFQTLLFEAVHRPHVPLAELALLPGAELSQLARFEHPAGLRTSGYHPVHTHIETQARVRPDAVAVVCGTTHTTYRQLNFGANRLARELAHRGCGPGGVVAVALRRRTELVVAILAVLKAGAAYLPVDPAQPADRVQVMLTDAGVSAVIGDPEVIASWRENVTFQVISPDMTAGPGCADPGTVTHPAALAAVFYTSGSAGTPKGIAIEQRNVAALTQWAREFFAAGELAVVLAGTSAGFDVSMLEILAPLSSGGTVVLMENALCVPETAWAPNATMLDSTPGVLAALCEAGGLPPSLLSVHTGGEPASADLVRRLRERLPHSALRNFYGPAETTVNATGATLTGELSRPPIGTAITPAAVWVTSSAGTQVPADVVGELVVGGELVSRGYLGNARLTADAFRPHRSGRVYLTGDIARRRGDGQLEFLGRRDDQIKVRGVRIEPGDVEAALLQIPGVGAAAAVPAGHDLISARLAGFVVLRPGISVAREDISAALRLRLPANMVAEPLIVLEKLPYNRNGKVDRELLSRLAAEVSPVASEVVTPRTRLEHLIAQAWCEVLGVASVDVHRGFFEAGGTSLTLLRLRGALSRRLAPAPSLMDLFRFPTVAALAAHLDSGDGPDMLNTDAGTTARLTAARRRGERRAAAMDRRVST